MIAKTLLHATPDMDSRGEMRAYHFVGDTLRDGNPIPADGVPLVFDGPVEICQTGLHYSLHPFDALQYAPGSTLCLVEVDDIVAAQDDKGVCRQRTIVKRIDATQLLHAFARRCALDVIHLWDAPPVVREYLETGNESLRGAAWAAARGAARDAARGAAWAAARGAAWDAARGAAWNAAGAAAGAAAWDAAWDAARGVQKTRFAEMVEEVFK